MPLRRPSPAASQDPPDGSGLDLPSDRPLSRSPIEPDLLTERDGRSLVSLTELLARVGTEARLDGGSYLWREGDPGDEVVLLLDGVLEVVSDSPEGNVVVLGRLEPVSVLGEIACLDGRSRSAGVRAVSDVRVARYPASAFREQLRSRPEILEQLLFQQIETVRRLTNQVTRQHQRAITDPLTGLYNVGFFNERLTLELERAEKTGDPLSVVLLDIDHFKNYNDANGHQAGDEALFRVAQILKQSGRRGDIVARYGGEEFIVLLYGADGSEGFSFAEKARRRVEDTTFGGGEGQPGGRVTISAGVSAFPAEARSEKELVATADRNLYRAKEEGRNRVVGSA